MMASKKRQGPVKGASSAALSRYHVEMVLTPLSNVA
jgi:hypothetical protein